MSDKEIKLQIDCAYFQTLTKNGQGYTTDNFIGLESYDYMERFNNGGCSGFVKGVYMAVYPDSIYFEFDSQDELVEALTHVLDYAYDSVGWELLRP